MKKGRHCAGVATRLKAHDHWSPVDVYVYVYVRAIPWPDQAMARPGHSNWRLRLRLRLDDQWERFSDPKAKVPRRVMLSIKQLIK